MASQTWVKKKEIYCDRVKQKVYLVEERIFPGNTAPDVGQPYRVRAQKCSAGVECNIHGFRCKWSGLNPTHDPFYDIEVMKRR